MTLERWCDVHHLASPATIVADRLPGADKPATPALRRELGVGPTETIRYRRVNLRCGAMVLHFQRRTLSSTVLWHPLPEGWEMQTEQSRAEYPAPGLPAHVLEHRAVLVTPDGIPFSEVVETYTDKVLGFQPLRERKAARE